MDKDRLRKLVEALLHGTWGTPEEEASARRKAAELMLSAGVTTEELLNSGHKIMRQYGEVGRREWNVAKYVFTPVARLSGCRAYSADLASKKTGGRTDRKGITFAGYGPDVENAIWLFNSLLRQADQMLRGIGLPASSAQGKDALAAFGSRVAGRIDELADSMDAVREERRALDADRALAVVDKEDEILRFLRENGVVLQRTHTGTRHFHGDAVALGRSAADRATLGRSVAAGGPTMLPGRRGK